MTRNADLSRSAAAILGLSIAAGMALAAVLAGEAAEGLLASRRYVAVKGLAEREVEADLAVWPIAYTVSGDTLAEVQARMSAAAEDVRRFLGQQGFDDSEISLSIPRITDFRTQMPGLPNPPADRYAAENVVTLRTRDVAGLRAAVQKSGDLVARGIALARSYDSGIRFMFTSLDAIKPAMIAEATRDARRAARQFAEDSQSRVGAIRTARQGYFSVTDSDPFRPEHKTVRVVTTVEYFLVD